MLKRALILGTVIAFALPGIAPAKRTLKVKLTMQSVTLSTSAGWPGVGSRGVMLALVTTNGRRGAEIDYTTMTGHPTPTTWRFKGTGITYDDRGSVTSTLTGKVELRPDGSFFQSGKGRTTGGTGFYRGARGSSTFTGTQPAGSDVTTIRATGTIVLP